MTSKRVRLIVFVGIAAILATATVVVTMNQETPQSVKLAFLLLTLASLADPLKFLWDSLASKPDEGEKLTPEQRNRRTLIDNVQRSWIEGVLYDALRDAQFEIAVATKPVQAGKGESYADYRIPLNVLIRQGDSLQLINTRTVDALPQVFRDVNGKLLILGAPGSGKTILLLQLAEALLKEAVKDENKPIPVVLNLSSWAVKREKLENWIVEELQRSGYGVPKKLAQQLVGTDKLIFLLDGLDEVAEQQRNDCVAAINAFMKPERQVLICSRVEEYKNLATKLNTHTAIETQSLSDEQVESYLQDYLYPEMVDNILRVLRADNAVWQAVNKPLFINILISTYRDHSLTAIPLVSGTIETQIQEMVIEPYITHRLQTTPADAPYANDKTRRYLIWLAWQLQKRELTTFYIEELQPYWLGKKEIFIIYFFILLFMTGVPLGMSIFTTVNNAMWLAKNNWGMLSGVFFFIGGSLTATLINLRLFDTKGSILFGAVFGVALGLGFEGFYNNGTGIYVGMTVTGFLIIAYWLVSKIVIKGGRSDKRQIVFVENIRWSWIRSTCGLILGIIVGVATVTIASLVVSNELYANIGYLYPLRTYNVDLGFTLGAILGIIGFLVAGVSSRHLETRAVVNQGIHSSVRISIGTVLIFMLVAGIVLYNNNFPFLIPRGFVVTGGLLIGLYFGGSAILQHILVRLLLFFESHIPLLRYDKFLYYAKDRRFMRQVGGGFIFIHRYILEYFAAQYVDEEAPTP
jgi:eukaryotic-like serine/threonine-protein kinase